MPELVRRKAGLPAPLVIPQCSFPLKTVVKNILEPHPDMGAFPVSSHPPAIIAEAKSILASMASGLSPVTPEVLALWLEPILAGVRTERKAETFAAWFSAVMLMAKDLPNAVFNGQTQITALRTIKFFPSASDIYDAIASEYRPLLKSVRVLKQISEMPTDEEYEQARAKRFAYGLKMDAKRMGTEH